MSDTLERTPLDPSSFPASLQNHIKPESPPPLKMMAARGMVPAPPEFSVRVLYQLTFDPDANVQNEALKALEAMPVAVILPPLQAEQPAVVLDWILEQRSDPEVAEAILLNRGTDDRTIAVLAGKGNAKICDVIANNQVRVLRFPKILEELYKNPNARMATIDKLIDLAQRNNVKLDGLPGLQTALDSGQDIGAGATADDEGFADLLNEQVELAAQEEVEAEKRAAEEAKMTRRERELKEKREARAESEEEIKKKPLFARLATMNIAQKIRLATIGNREAAMLLVRENNRLIHMAAIQSPRLKYSDIKKLASNKSMPDGVIRYIANNREWAGKYEIQHALLNNPKTPLEFAMNFLKHMRTNDLRHLMKNRNVPQQLRRQAKVLATKRSGGGH